MASAKKPCIKIPINTIAESINAMIDFANPLSCFLDDNTRTNDMMLVTRVKTDNIISGLLIHDITFIKVYGVLNIIIKINTFNTMIPNTVYMQMSASLEFLIKALQNFTILKHPEYTQ